MRPRDPGSDDYVGKAVQCSVSREGAVAPDVSFSGAGAFAQAGIVPLFERSLGSDE